MIDRNGAQAAIRAGYSPRTARQMAYELLTVPYIATEVARRSMEVSRRLEIDLETVITKLGEAYVAAKDQGRPDLMIEACREIAKLCGFYERLGS